MTPLVVAHRGASADFAEHTVAAYENAIAVGADALECDVRLTADGELVCIHDSRIDRVSNGTGAVASSTLAELRQWDFTSWKSGAEPAPRGEVEARDSVLTLDTLLELATSAGRPVGLSIETKHPTRQSLRVEAVLTVALKRFGLIPAGKVPADPHAPGAVRMMSFSMAALQRMRSLVPSLPTVFLTSAVPDRYSNGTLPYGAVVAGPWLELVRRDWQYVERVHERGHRAHVWTVDELDDVRWCRDSGVDAIITNRPAAVLKELGRV